jgi:hypothetical protein
MEEKNMKVIKDGVLDLAGNKIPCCVLEDETRGFSGREMQETLGMVDEGDKNVSGKRLVRYLEQKSLQPFIDRAKTLVHFEPIICYKGRKKIHIYDANLLPEMCIIFLELEREAIRKDKKLPTRQAKIAERAKILLGAFAKTGINALIDEATGYQYEREKNALQKR